MFFYTFHTSFSILINKYGLTDDDILYSCRHYGKDKNGLDIKSHFHIIANKEIIFDYDEIFTYKNKIDYYDAKKIISYCENGHCDFSIVYVNEFFYSLLKSIDLKKYTIDDLINEIVYNSENSIIKSHSYYLKKYGKVYLFNFKKIREMFDDSSAFYDWTDTSSVPP